jgi:hypothetical protein
MMYVGRFVLKEKYYILICTVDMLVENTEKSEKKRNEIELRCSIWVDIAYSGASC